MCEILLFINEYHKKLLWKPQKFIAIIGIVQYLRCPGSSHEIWKGPLPEGRDSIYPAAAAFRAWERVRSAKKDRSV